MKNTNTIKEVAQQAGVSVTTVSHVINNTRFVSEETRQKVLDAMAALDYQPNALARSLRRGSTNTIGLILPDSANPFYAEISRSLTSTAFKQGYFVILCNTDEDPDQEQNYLALLAEKRVDGVILLSAGVHNIDVLRAWKDNGLPIVGVDRVLAQEVALDCVSTNNEQGGYLATRHLIDLGHRRIGCITGPANFYPNIDRLTGYRRALAEAGLSFDPALVADGDFHMERAHEVALTWFKSSQAPTAIFACNDLMAIGVLHAAAEVGKRIPQDVAVVGYDDIDLASYTTPTLTSVAQPKAELGKIAVELLLERIHGSESQPMMRLLDPVLMTRGSTVA